MDQSYRFHEKRISWQNYENIFGVTGISFPGWINIRFCGINAGTGVRMWPLKTIFTNKLNWMTLFNAITYIINHGKVRELCIKRVRNNILFIKRYPSWSEKLLYQYEATSTKVRFYNTRLKPNLELSGYYFSELICFYSLLNVDRRPTSLHFITQKEDIYISLLDPNKLFG